MSVWYVMRVSLGKERKIEERLNLRINEGSLPSLTRFVCPVEKEYYAVEGKKHVRDRVIYGGYLYLEAADKLNKEIMEEVVSDIDVKSFLGSKGSPQTLSRTDVDRIIKDEVLAARIAAKSISIDVGTRVKINEGPFIEFVGVVTEIDYDKNKVKVKVKFFERDNLVDLSLNQIEKTNGEN